MVEDDPVGVVDDLGFVAEFDRFAQASFADRAGVDIVQADEPAGRLGHHPGQAATGLGDNAFGASHDGAQVVDRPVQPAFALAGRGAQRASGVADHRAGLAHRLLGDPGQFPGDTAHRGLGLVALLLTAQAQLRGDRAGPPTRRAAPVARPCTGCATGGFDPLHGAGHRADRLGQQTRIGRVGHSSLHHGGVGATLSVRSTLAVAALASSASFNPATASSPHRVVIFINVVGCGTRIPNGIRQNRDGRPIRASKYAANGAKNTGSSSRASTRPNSTGNTNNSAGRIESHNVGWSFTVLNTMASIPSSPRG